MGVKTAADGHLDKARKYLALAVEELSELVVRECWGTEDFTEDAIEKYHSAFLELLNTKRALGPRRYFDEEDE